VEVDDDDDDVINDNSIFTAQPCCDWEEFFAIVIPLALYLGPFIAHNGLVFAKLCRLCVSFMEMVNNLLMFHLIVDNQWNFG